MSEDRRKQRGHLIVGLHNTVNIFKRIYDEVKENVFCMKSKRN